MLAASALWLAGGLGAASFHVYIGDITSDSALIAWGTTEGKSTNTIGYASEPQGDATVVVTGTKHLVTGRNWIRVRGLEADRDYPYEVSLEDKTVGNGSVRTHPVRAERVAFVVIGDYGTGKSDQWRLAERLTRLVKERLDSPNPIRFVLTTGDNVYGPYPYWFNTGIHDARWEKTHFGPYADVLRHIPFYMTLGNHDGNESEKRGDLGVQLDNFFFPGNQPSRYYRFSYGGLVDFFALDSTSNTTTGSPSPALDAESEQVAWLRNALAGSSTPWKVAYFHHAMFSAGPRHRGSLPNLVHVHDLFVQHGVQVVFNGHEHNLQFTDPAKTSGIQYVVTGSGGELRRGKPSRSAMEAEHIAGWAAQRQFCLVEIEGDRMTVTPMGYEPIQVTKADGSEAELPIVITRR